MKSKIVRLSRTPTFGLCLSFFFVMLMMFSCQLSALAASTWPYADETQEQRDARMEWWREARFGMFIHWGVYAVPAGTYNNKQIDGIGEWIMLHGEIPVAAYKAYAEQFNPVKYDPDAWVRLAKEAGMKYIVITSKHHDGFALFDSKVTDWDIVDATPYGKDLLKPLAEACRRHGIKLGFYYSQAQDWCHPGGAKSGNRQWDPAQAGDMDEYIRTIAVPQVKEILTNYGDIAVLWWDTPSNMNPERAAMFEPVVSAFPGIITNNRLGGGYPGDTETPEQHIPATGYQNRDWETCMTMNDTWGFKSYDQNWKSVEMLIRNLIDIAGKGGNYLLNVGPTAEGEIPQPSIERLKAVGKWMSVNGEAIYGTTAGPFAKLEWGRCTKKVAAGGTTLYLHVFDWPKDGKLLVPGLKNKVKSVRLLATGQTLKAETAADGVTVTVPAACPDAIAAVIVMEAEGDIQIDKIVPKQDADGVVALPAILADIHNVFGTNTQLESKQGIYNIGYWTDARCRVQWQFRVDRAGVYEIAAEVAVQGGNSRVTLKIGDKAFTAQFFSTGSYDTFRTQRLGSVALDALGVYTLEVTPVQEAWTPINVRSVTLRPFTGPRAETPAQFDARMAWWREARFGMFIHWGVYAVPAGEWGGKTNYAEWIMDQAQIPLEQYEPLCEQFNPVKFDADAWVRMASDAGMKYLVITSKHHDGFCLWPTEAGDYHVKARTPFKRDILGELAEACKKHDVRLCFYHSIMDWHHPDYLPRRKWEKRSADGADYSRYVAYMKTQLKEMVTRYDPAVLWFDGEWENTWTHEQGLDLYDYVRSLKPDIIVNNRVDKGRQGMQGTYDTSQFAGDFGTPEQEIPGTGLDYDWESCITMNRHWGWNKNDKAFKSAEEMIRSLADIAGKGGNYLLNIGPKPDGTFPQESVDRLAEIGQWMKVNGISIYNTTAGPFEKLDWGRCTRRTVGTDTVLYLHVFDWPKDGRLAVPGLKNEAIRAALLATGQTLEVSREGGTLLVHVPSAAPDAVNTVIMLEMKGQPLVTAVPNVQ